MTQVMSSAAPGLFEVITPAKKRSYVYFGEKLPRGVNSNILGRQITIIQSLEHFKEVAK